MSHNLVGGADLAQWLLSQARLGATRGPLGKDLDRLARARRGSAMAKASQQRAGAPTLRKFSWETGE
jgi:hypothetical protein